MKNGIWGICCFTVMACMAVTCKKQSSDNTVIASKDTSLVNLSHLDYLYIPITFPDGANAAGVYIYADAPDYH